MIFGIDFSIKSPAICVKNGRGEISFLSFPRRSTAKDDFVETLVKSGVNISVIPDEKSHPKNATLAERERSSLLDAKQQLQTVLEVLRTCRVRDIVSVDVTLNMYKIYAGIEGFSFASTGNRLAQISGYQWLLRFALHNDLRIEAEDLYVYAPMTVKATAGKGNYKKEDMIEAFLRDEDPALRKTGLWQGMTENPSHYQNKKGAWLKPIDDIVDSYWVLRTVEKHMNVSQN
jgi:hypothetical protein